MDKQMIQDNFRKTFIRYVSFNILGMIGLSCYILADTFFIANGIGSSGLTALNLVLPIYSFISGIGLMLGMGGATRYSILKGKDNIKKGSKLFGQVLALGMIIGLILTIIGLFFSGYISELLGADTAVKPLAETYLRTILIFSCPFIINNILICFVRNDNSPNLSMMGMLLGSFSNIILDYVFIFPLGMGMFGAAFATGLAPIISILTLSTHWLRKKNNLVFIKSKLHLKEVKKVLAIGFPSFITEFSSGIIMLLFNFTILNIAGNIGVAAYGIIANLALIVVAVFTGIAQGVQPLISSYFSKAKMDFVKKTYLSGAILSILIGGLCYLVGILFPNTIVNIFNSEGNAILSELAVKGLRLYFLAFFIMGINILTTSFFSSIGKARESFIISITRGGLGVVPLIFILPYFFGLTGVWLTIPFGELITLIISIGAIIKYNSTLRKI